MVEAHRPSQEVSVRQTRNVHIEIVSAETAGKGIIIHFSIGTTTLFQTRFLYEVRDQDGNIELTDLSEDDLMKGFDD